MRGKVPPNVYRIVSFDEQIFQSYTGGEPIRWRITVSSFAKCNCDPAPYHVPNEYICGEIGRFLRLPVPPGGLVYAPDLEEKQWYASLDFNLTGNTLPPVMAYPAWERLPNLCTGILLFDILIANPDRHRGNLSSDDNREPTTLNVFDHGYALFGKFAGEGTVRLTNLRERLGVSGGEVTLGTKHCFLSVADTDMHFAGWLERIRAIPDFFIEDVCDAAIALGITEAERNAAVDFLKYRRDQLRSIIDAHRGDFTRIDPWSLLP